MGTLIGLCGPKGAGKDTVFKIISKHIPNAKRFACADLLKLELTENFGLDPQILHGTQVQ